MNIRNSIFILFSVFIFTISGSLAYGADYRNFYAIAWRGKALDNLKYARQMGYGYVAYQNNMQNMPEAADLKFYLTDPEYLVYPVHSVMNLSKTYLPEEKAKYEKYFVLRSNTAPFPSNIATSWWFNDNEFRVLHDFQQQSVIDETVEAIIAKAKSLENVSINFRFAGLMWDVPDLRDMFMTGPQVSGGRFVGLEYWTGKDSCASSVHKHNYSTYSEAKAAYYKQLYRRVREEFPDAKFIMEPWRIKNWIKEIKDLPDATELMPDMLVQESWGTAFVDEDYPIYKDFIQKDHIGLTTPTTFGEQQNRIYAAKAAINGSWFSWYGRFGGNYNDDMPNYQNIYEVPARHQLIRMLPNWDNIAGVPLTQRSWDGKVYKSPNSYADANIIYSRHPKTGKIFVVFLNESGKVNLLENEQVNSVYRTDNLFIESKDGRSDVQIAEGEIRLNSSATTGKGYIITTNRQKADSKTPTAPLNLRIAKL